MNFLNNALAEKLDFDFNNMIVFFKDGRILSVPLAYFPRLLNAEKHELLNYELSGGGTGIHWDNLNEDISVEYLLLGYSDQTVQERKIA